MKRLGLFLAFLGAFLLAIALAAPHASASTNCHATGNWCQGDAYLNVAGTVGARYWHLTTSATDPGDTSGNQATWELDAGSSITLKFFSVLTGGVSGVSAPGIPTSFTLAVYYETGTGTLVRTLSSTLPASGTTYTFYGTSTGLNGGAARSGTLRLYVHAIVTGTTGGLFDYNADTDGACTVGASLTCGPRDAAALRTNILVPSIARNAYPADSKFAYGPSADESVTITPTYTLPYGDANIEKIQSSLFDAATLATTGELGTCVDQDTNSFSQSFVVDSTYTFAGSPYVGGMKICGASGLTSLSWTQIATTGNGANIVRDSTVNAHDSTSFAIDSRIVMDSDASGTFATADGVAIAKITNCSGTVATLYNKGETVCTSTGIYNARSELLSRAMTFSRQDSANTVCQSIGSVTPSSNLYQTTATLGTGATCLAAADTTGSTRHYVITNTDQTYTSGTIFSVSSLLRFDQDGSGTPDNLVHECLTSCPGTDITIFNRGETVDYEGYLINARGTQYSNAAAIWTAKASDATTTNTQTPSLSAGKYSGAAFTLSSSEKATADTTGDPHTFTATADGNTATTGTDFAVSSLYFVDAHIQLSATLVQDNFPTQNANEDTAYIISNAVTDTTHGWCHVVNVRKDGPIDTSGSAVAWSYKDPTPATRLSGTTDTGADGWTPTHLDLLASTPLGTWTFNCAVTSFNGNSGTDVQTFTVSVPTGGGGFPGDPLRLLCAPIITNPGETVTCTASENNVDGSARTGNTAGTLYDLWNPSNTQIVTGGAVTEIGTTGNYRWTYSPGGSPALGNYIFVVRTTDASPVSSSTVITIETDPTVALATSIATIITNQGTAATSTEHLDSTLDNVQSTQNTTLVQIEHLDSTLDNVQSTQNTTLANQATNLATILAEIEATEGSQDVLLNATAAQILAALSNLNVTLTGNFTIDQAALANITANLQETHIDVHELQTNLTAHRNDPLELNGMPLETTSQLTSLFPLLAALIVTAFLLRFPVWVAPGAILVGFGVFFLAFRQSIVTLAFVQAAAGLLLVLFSLYAIGYHYYTKPAKQPRKYFDE